MSNGNLVTAIASAISAAITSPTTGTLAASIFHTGAVAQGLDFSKKTMTTTWYAANQSSGIMLAAEGWSIIPG